MTFIRTLRKLVLGETWVLPIGVALAVGAAGVLRALAGDNGWWHSGGGFVLLGLVLVALLAAARRPTSRRR
jgi:membrane protein implicated in regulation of membrane protease activity